MFRAGRCSNECLMRYGWVKLMRSHLPEGKGILGMWAKLASRAAFRKGTRPIVVTRMK